MSKKLISLIPQSIHSPFNRTLFNKILQPFVNENEFKNINRTVYSERVGHDDIDSPHVDTKINQYQPLFSDGKRCWSFYDIVALLNTQEFNLEDFDSWGECNASSLTLPINLDKFVNYTKYGWIDTSTPNYVVIRNNNVQLNEKLIQQARDSNDPLGVLAYQQALMSTTSQTDEFGGFDMDDDGLALPSTLYDDYLFDGDVGTISTSSTFSDWEINNKWVHVDDMVPGTAYALATFPIIEYSNKLKMVNWQQMKHEWYYRVSPNSQWEITSNSPSLDELFAGQNEIVKIYAFDHIDIPSKRIYMDDTSSFATLDQIIIFGSDNRWNVGAVTSSYLEISDANFSYFSFPVKQFTKITTFDVVTSSSTQIVIKGLLTTTLTGTQSCTILPFFSDMSIQLEMVTKTLNLPAAGFTTLTFTNNPLITPNTNGRFTNVVETSLNHKWLGFTDHWCYNGVKESVIATQKTYNTLKTELLITTVPDVETQIIQLPQVFPNSNLFFTVYINGKPTLEYVYGNYNAFVFTEMVSEYGGINAIKLNAPILSSVAQTITVEYGFDAQEDLINRNFIVRTDRNQLVNNIVCLNNFKRFYQFQSKFNMYPLFELYTLSNTPELLSHGGNIVRFSDGTTNQFVKALDNTVAIEEPFIFKLETDLVQDDGLSHIMYKFDTEYKHLWSNNNNRIISISKVDENGKTIGNLNYYDVPEYINGNLYNETFKTFSIKELATHFAPVVENNPNYRSLSENNVLTNQNNKFCIYDTKLGNIVTEAINGTSFENILNNQKTLRYYYLQTMLDYVMQFAHELSLTNAATDFDIILLHIKSNDGLKIINKSNDLLHPVTVPMLFGLHKTLPINTSKLVSTHDNAIFTGQHLFDIIKANIPSNPLYNNIPASPVANDMYINNSSFFKHNGAVWVEYPIIDVLVNIVYELEMKLYTKCTNTLTYVGLINQTVIDNVNKEKYIEYAESKLYNFPFSNRSVYNVTDPFTWNYSGVLLSNVVSPIGSLTPTDWGISYKQIYFKLFNTQYPNLFPWKLQGYNDQPSWWNAQYSGLPTRLWSDVMWSNIKLGIVPVGVSHYLADNVTLATGLANQVATYDFVCVNDTSFTSSDGYGPDALLPPFRNVTITPFDVILQNNILIRDISFININDTNFANVSFGQGSLQEWEWIESIHSSYDDLLCHHKSDPTTIYQTLNDELIDGVVFNNKRLLNHTTIQNQSNTNLLSWYSSYATFFNSSFSITDWKGYNLTMGVLFGGYININDTIIKDIDAPDITHIVKADQTNIIKNVTNFKLSLQNISRNTSNNRLEGWDFSIDVFNKDLNTISYYDLLYSDITNVTEFACDVNSNFYNDITHGARIIVTWDYFTPSEFDSQDYFYVHKNASTNSISLCRSLFDVKEQNFVQLPVTYNYPMHIGVVADDYKILNGQITGLTFNTYAVNYKRVLTANAPFIISGLQNTLNMFEGYIAHLRTEGITEYDFRFPNVDSVANKEQNYKFARELLIATLYNDKLLRQYHVGKVYAYMPFNNHIFVSSTSNLKSLVVDINHHNSTVIYDSNGNNMSVGDVLVFRNAPFTIQTTKQIGGATIILDTTQNVGLLSSNIVELSRKRYPLSVTYDTTVTGNEYDFVTIEDKHEYNFNALSNMYRNINRISNKNNIFDDMSKRQIGFEPHPWYDEQGLSNETALGFWKDSLPIKGSIQCYEPFNGNALSNLNVDEIVAIKQNVFGDRDLLFITPVELQNKKYIVQNVNDNYYSFAKQPFVNHINQTELLSQNGVLTLPNLIVNNEFNTYSLRVDFTNQYIFEQTFERITGSVKIFTFAFSTSIPEIDVVVNNVTSEYVLVNHTTSFDIVVTVDNNIQNNIVIQFPKSALLTNYSYVGINSITFDESIISITPFDYKLIGNDYVLNHVGFSETDKSATTTLQYFDPVKGVIPGVDYFSAVDPFSDYNFVNNEINVNSKYLINHVGHIWYKKSQCYIQYTNTEGYGDFHDSLDFYGMSSLGDDGYYQFVESSISPETWHNTTSDQNVVDSAINGIPHHEIQYRTRALDTDPWSSWLTISMISESFIVSNLASVSPTIGELGDILIIMVNKKFDKVVIKDADPINVSSGLYATKVVDIFIRPELKTDTDLIEYRTSFSYCIREMYNETKYYFWVKNYNTRAERCAYKLSVIHNETKKGLYGLVNDNNIVLFNNSYDKRNGDVVVTNKNIQHDLWSYHANTDSDKVPLSIWNRCIECFNSTNPLFGIVTIKENLSIDGIVCLKQELVSTINETLINYKDILYPYTVSDLLVSVNTDFSFLRSLYGILPLIVINTIVQNIMFTRDFDVSDVIIQTSLVNLTVEGD